jgi:isocitrate dehydrogenase
MPKITYTLTDEAPALATQSLLPIIKTFAGAAGIEVELKDISLAGRILSQFPEWLKPEQRQEDDLNILGEMSLTPDANIIKLPNISASIPQLKAAILELQTQGYELPDYPEEPNNEKEQDIKDRYSKILGSAVNPVLREGNSDRRVARPVKNFAQNNPHSMGPWSSESKSHVAHMSGGDFYGSEQSLVMESDNKVEIKLVHNGEETTLKKGFPLQKGEVIDCAVMSAQSLSQFLLEEVKSSKEEGVLFSVHLKATMMKVSDPIMFGEAVKAYFKPVFDQHGPDLKKADVDPRQGLGDLLKKIQSLPPETIKKIEESIRHCLEDGPGLAMVDSDKGITNLHVPSDVIIDASMPAAIRSSGQMWNRHGKLQDMKAVIPDRCYAGVYQETIQFCKKNGAFNPATMGSVANVGLMAKKAEEYGSHDKTFWIKQKGEVQVVDHQGRVLMKQAVEPGDIFRMCQTQPEAIKDWVQLAVNRARLSQTPAYFWLDPQRAHDRELIQLVQQHLKEMDTQGLTIEILSPTEATQKTLQRVSEGLDTISVTGNVLRDYLTDLFPILELGTSAKMLSIVPLLNGGGLFETGAGGSAPKHVQQLNEVNFLRWDSLGEFLALGASLEDLANKTSNSKIAVLAKTLDVANQEFLNNNKSPQRKPVGLDNRGSHFYLALYWAQALAKQDDDLDLKQKFATLAQQLSDNEDKILKELESVQGQAVDLGGYYRPNVDILQQVMRPSPTLNAQFNT